MADGYRPPPLGSPECGRRLRYFTILTIMFTTTILGGLLPQAALFMGALALFVSAIGFKKFVYFISIGYGYSIAAISIASLALAGGSASAITWIEALLLGVYGLRLGTYLAIREGKSAYQATQAADGDRSGSMGFLPKLGIWVTVAVLYVAMFMPALSRFAAEARLEADPAPALGIVGIAVTALGIAIESIADAQKSAAKKAQPKRFCDAGLYRITRCPNYFGEMLVWTGNLLAGAALLGNALAWAIAVVAYACIILIMIGSARRLELKQEARYGADPEFKRYVAAVPVILPWIPVYSLKNAKIYLG
jgi:steroid 5-alpha reductase family enzyme